ncbi:mucin-5AC isoform X1 [Patella vulgata]|uniref:mucin-5AC isoform X1 n=1 Tax=Patella vulgata TaxID=6465 RepID=UPI00217F77C2|nr:mucin-5AC isoform X1 [Patella vulgata]
MSRLFLSVFVVCFTGVNLQCYVQPKIQDGFSVDNLHEGENQIKQLTCITCTCNGDPIAHYVVELVSINFPTYCRRCFSIYNLTNVIIGSPPNYCLYYVPGVIPISYRRGSVFDMTVRCTVENTATTPMPTTPPTPNPIPVPVPVPVPSLPECTVLTTASLGATTMVSEMLTPTPVTTIDPTVADTTTTAAAGTTVTAAAGTTATAAAGTTTTVVAGTTATVVAGTTVTAVAGTTATAAVGTTATITADTTATAASGPTTTAAADTTTTAAADTTTTAATDTTTTTAADTTVIASTMSPPVPSATSSIMAAAVSSSVLCTNPSSATQLTTTSVTTAPVIVTTPTPGTIPPFLTAEGRIQVRVIPNRPPVFNPLAVSITKNAIGVNDGGIVYTVPVTDPEGDPIYFTMSVDPRTTNFYIDGSGNIRAVKTLRSECSAAVYTFSINATDNLHDPVGPHVATVRLSGTSTAPTARGLNQEFFYKETLRVPTFIVKWSASSDTKKTVLSYNPTSARTRFREVATTLRTSQEMDFETFPRINITFTFSNDNCQSKYYILIRIGDENDKPVLGPAEQSLKVDEGQVFAQPNYIITDGDFNDRHTFSFFRDRTGGYNIDPFTGAISHPTGVIIDKIREMEVSFQVVVTDEKNSAESNKILVKLLIQDINNHAPEFMVKSFTRTATACDLPQQLDIKLEFFDSDSSQNGNADISIIPVTSGPLTVTPDGTVYMTTNIKAGESYIVQAYAKDHGTNPGSLTSIVPVTITLIGKPCPTPAPTLAPIPTTAAPSSGGSGTAGTGGSSGSININQQSSSNINTNSGGSSNSGASASASSTTTGDATDSTAAVVLGIILALVLLAGLLYLLYRFCLPKYFPDAHYRISNAFNSCSERCCPRKYNFTEPRGHDDFFKNDFNNKSNKNVNLRNSRPQPYQYPL